MTLRLRRLIERVENKPLGVVRYESPTWLVWIAMILGGFLTSLVYQIPNKPDAYTVTASERCLDKDGITLRLGYAGRGTVDITVVPPGEPNPGQAPEKEKK
jgi:hypothetical protein